MRMRIPLIFALIVFLSNCRGRLSSVPELSEAYRILDEVPDSIQKADSLLKSLNPKKLNEGDRNLLDLLSIKADDKLFVEPASDSLVLKVVEYEKVHRSRGLYPEALYYAGRVYTELGDYPTATQWYEKALFNLPDEAGYKKLEMRIAYHLGHSLVDQCLYDSAEKELLRSLHLAESLNNKDFILYNYELLGNLEMNRVNVDKSLYYLEKAKEYTPKVIPSDSVFINSEIAFMLSEKGEMEAAMSRLNNRGELVDSDYLSLTLPLEAKTYLRTGETEKAFHAAKHLLSIKNRDNWMVAYFVLLDPRLQIYMPPDSTRKYAIDYGNIICEHYARRDSVQAYHQQSYYNYSLHERRRAEAERSSKNWRTGGLVLLVLLLSGVIFFLYRERLNNKRKLIFQRKILDLTAQLDKPVEKEISPEPIPELTPETIHKNEEAEKLRNELIAMIDNLGKEEPTDERLLSMEIVDNLRNNSARYKMSPDDWMNLEKKMSTLYPAFRENLDLLTGGFVTEGEYKVALLIKCGLRPSNISNVMDVKLGTISKRRSEISRKIFGKNIGTKSIDAIIKRL